VDDALLLSRVQFGLNIGFHILFPTITIGLAWIVAWFRIQYERTRDEAWLRTYKLWLRVFALTFAMGVVSGVTMSFQFGTNWPGYMNRVGNVAGPLLAYEVLTAFFLEATFLGVMLFGMQRVSGRMHIASALIVAFGTTLSAFWILALNSWMQTPTGHTIVGGVLVAESWWRVIFNPSFVYRLVHMLLASGVSAALKTLRFGARLAAVLVPLQIIAGDLHGLNTLEHQPAKIAALEAIWHTERGAALTLFGLPNEREGRTDFAVMVPKGASLILAHDANAELKGIDAFEDHPPVAPMFFAFRVMVGMGVAMLFLSWFSQFFLRAPPRWLLWTFAGFTFAGWIATLAGWLVTEIGRQPWLVTGILRTADAVGPASGAHLGASLMAYVLTYSALLLAYMVTLTHLSRRG